MYRFGSKKNLIERIGSIHFSMLLFVLLFVLFLYSVSYVSEESLSRQEKSLCDALNRSIVSCYSIEGTYPPSLDYLKEHYGLTYDDDVFFVDYRSIGSNIFPDVTVLRRDK